MLLVAGKGPLLPCCEKCVGEADTWIHTQPCAFLQDVCVSAKRLSDPLYELMRNLQKSQVYRQTIQIGLQIN